MLLRIESNPAILAEKPVVKGTRLSVQFIVGLLAKGSTHREILDEYAYLSEEDGLVWRLPSESVNPAP